jgi:peptidoglycan/LPS O-acetylase OafA/YrhL
MSTSKTYFPGLNALRFFAAMAVLVTHVEFTKKVMLHGDKFWLKIDSWIQGNALTSILRDGPPEPIHWLSPFVTFGGYIGVIFFFVLSGFLITYLILEEKRVSQDVSVKKFYMRRILRIWPLYYFLVFLGFFVLHHIPFFEVISQEDEFFDHYAINLVSFLFLLPNLSFALVMEGVPNLGHLWSIGVEEQFYLFWPVLLKFSKKPMRTLWFFLIGLITFKLLSFVIIRIFFPEPPPDPDLMIFSPIESYKRFIGSLKFEAMAIGGIGAGWIFYEYKRILNFIYLPFIQWLAILSIPIIVLITPVKLYTALYLFFSIPFLVIILNVATNKDCRYRLQHVILDYLGKISYGIYMYHLICIAFVFHTLDYWLKFPLRLEAWHTMLLYALSIPLTIGVSALSYHFLESPFIRKKRTFTTVISGDDARVN